MTSFDFTWTDPGKPAGKVFARKRNKNVQSSENPSKTAKNPESHTINTSPNKPQVQREKTVQNQFRLDSSTFNIQPSERQPSEICKVKNRPQKYQESSADFSAKLIKRKLKKDKVAAKALGNEGGQQHNSFEKQGASHSLFSVRKKDLYVNAELQGKSIVEKVFSAEKKFSDLDIHKHLISNLEKHSFTTLTKVQEKSIPVITTGKNVLIRSQTGSGKTLAYAVPIMDALLNINPRLQRGDGVQVLVMVPTRELALQTHELFGLINTFQWIVIGHLCGGENRKTEKDRLRKGVHVLIGTPGRLLDHILHTSAFKIQNMRCLVLDEADRLLDMGFKKDVTKIVEELDRAKTNSKYDPMAMLKGKKIEETVEDLPPLKNPQSKNRQTILLSATLTKGIAELADFIMKEHIYVDSLDDSHKINEDHMSIPNTVSQEFVMVYAKHRLFTLAAVLLEKAEHKVFVFMTTTQMVNYHYELFTKYLLKMPKNRGKSDQVPIFDNPDFEESDAEEEVVLDTQFFKLHGNMDQKARKEVFTAFRSAKKGILLCTDVGARGIDVPEADCIIQYTGPQTDEDYLHRVGRTGRAGKSGTALIFLTHEEQEYISRLQDHKVYLKKREPEEFLKELCVLMEEPEEERAASALQRRFEMALTKDKELHKLACLAYSSWSRFYNTYPQKLRPIFNFKDVNLGHYATSFALKETPSEVAKIVKGQITSIQTRKVNNKLATHSTEEGTRNYQRIPKKRKIKSISLTTSEFSSGLPQKKKKKK